MRPEIKACRECKYFKGYDNRTHYDAWKCSHPEIVEPNVIVGGYADVEAKTARYEGNCGIEAKYWEAKRRLI